MSATGSTSRRGVSIQVGPDGQEHEFDTSSVWDCDCGLKVKVGTGGFKNLEIHRASAEHARHLKLLSKIPAVRKLKDSSISSFFKPKTAAPAPSAPPLLRGPSTSISALTAASPITPPAFPTPQLPVRKSPYAIICELQGAIRRIPCTVPEATILDVTASFAIPPVFPDRIREDQDAKEEIWEAVDATLNRNFGGDCSEDSIGKLLRRGPLGVQALCDWIELHIQDAGIDEVLFHGKILRIIRAIDKLCSAHRNEPALPESAGDPSQSAARNIIDLTADDDLGQSIDASTTDSGPNSSSAANPDRSVGTVHPLGPSNAMRRCYGLPVDLAPDRVAGAAYPWGMDISRRFAWRGNAVDGKLYIKSTFCHNDSLSPPCKECSDLENRPLVVNLLDRMRNGVSQFTNTLFLSWENMYDSNGRLRKENNKHKLGALSLARKLTRVAGTVDDHNRLVWAIANDDIPRVAAVLKVAINNKRSVRAMLSLVDKAARQVYHARSYTEKDFAVATLLYRLGGDTVSSLSSRALGLPSPETIRRHSHVPAIRVSAGYPTPAEITLNIDKMYPNPIPPPPYGTRTGVVLMIDECKVEERLRWDPSTNLILGTCREHASHLDLEFRNLGTALTVSSALQDKSVHLSKEMTVAALGPLVRTSRDQVARPILVSGTCKLEDAAAQMGLLQTIIETASKHAKLQHTRIYSIATDGEAKRGKALVPLTLCQTLPQDSPLYPVLSKLQLFNLLCGPGTMTLSKDPKHLFKRMRSSLLRSNGTSICGNMITPSILKEHLLRAGLSPEHALSLITESDEPVSEAVRNQVQKHLSSNGLTPSRVRSLMNPNDKQDVPLAYSLLVAIMKLPEPSPEDSFQWIRTRQALNLLGFMFGCFLKPFVTLSMSVSEQIEMLSTAMHLMLALYAEGRGAFVPIQLYADCAHMVKNAIFTVAKTQIDNPEGEYFLCLEGSDRLEDDFGNMRCSVGNDSNVDMLQASSRLAAAAEISIIFGDHPEWDRTKRRLQLKPLEEQGALLDKGVDHISPRSWTGDLKVSHVSIPTSWKEGRRVAAERLAAHGADVPFEQMEAKGNIDILRPIGSYCFNGELLDGEENEDMPEVATPTATTSTQSTNPDDLELDDYAAAELAEQCRADKGPTAASEPWVFAMSGDPTSKIYKATVLRCILDPLDPLGPDSTDRLQRVMGGKRYHANLDDLTPLTSADDGEDGSRLLINDIAATMLRCCNVAFTAIIQIASISIHSKPAQALHGAMLDDPLNHIGFQVLRLVPRDDDDHEGLDWSCTADTVRFASTDTLLSTIAPLIQPVKPVTVISADGSAPSMHFKKEDLAALTLLLLEKVERDSKFSLPSVKKVAYFPYRLNDKYCFAAQKPDDSSVGVDKLACDRCSSKVKIDSVPGLVNHIAAHILFDSAVRQTVQYCGFCFNSDGKCRFFLRKKGDNVTNQQLNLERCSCPRLPTQFSYGSAVQSKKSSPSSNVPIWCPLCPDDAPAVWKYNLKLHIQSDHPLADPQMYKDLWKLSRDEKDGLCNLWTRIRNSRKTKKPATEPKLAISAAHSTLMALHTSELDSDDEDQQGASIDTPEPQPHASTDSGSAAALRAAAHAPSHLATATSSAALLRSEMVPTIAQEDDLPPASDAERDTAVRTPHVEHPEDRSEPVDQVVIPAPQPATGRPKRKRGRAVIEEVCVCGEEATIHAGEVPDGFVECVGKGCETHWFHKACALKLKGSRELAVPFICPSCESSGNGAPKRARARR